MRSLGHDLRYALRSLAKSRGFTALAILTIALGIGANTAIFSVVYAVLLRALPYKEPTRLVLIMDPQDQQYGAFLYKDCEVYRAQARTLESVAVYYRNSGFSRVTLTAGSEPESLQAAFVSADLFTTMGIGPEIGRVFTTEEVQRGEQVVVLSHSIWLRRFGGSADVIGRELQVDGRVFKIIGVMPGTFQFPARDQQFWAPITSNRHWQDPELTTRIDPNHTRNFYSRWQMVARLRSGTTLRQAQADADAIFSRLSADDPDRGRGIGFKVVPLRVNVSGNTRRALIVLLSAVVLVLLIACSNVANLVLARGATRNREIAIRTALGAARARLIQQLATESLLVAGLAGLAGLALAYIGIRALVAFAPADVPRLNETGINLIVLAFTAGMSLFSAVVFGLLPAYKISQTDPLRGFNSAARRAGPHLLRDALVVVEFALAIILLSGAGLLIRSFIAVESVDLGFEPQRLLTMRITVAADIPQTRRLAVHDEVLERLAVMHGVEAVGAISDVFELGATQNLGLREVEGRAPESPEQWTPLIWKSVSGNFLQAIGGVLLQGRYFSEHDTSNSPLVALIDENLARRYWPGQDPVGKRFKGQDPRGRNDDWLTVIGVIGNMRRNGLERDPVPHVFEWYKQSGAAPADLLIRTTGNPRAPAATVRNIVRAIAATAVLSPISTMDEQLSDQLSPRQFQTSLLTLFSIIAMVLACVGIFGLMRHSVERRTHELGVRLALGAQRRDIMQMVLRDGGVLALTGVGLGLGGAMALTRFMSMLLFGVQPTDALTLATVSGLLILVGLVACYVPARCATRVDPLITLRYE